jgi:hypothetical protein
MVFEGDKSPAASKFACFGLAIMSLARVTSVLAAFFGPISAKNG